MSGRPDGELVALVHYSECDLNNLLRVFIRNRMEGKTYRIKSIEWEEVQSGDQVRGESFPLDRGATQYLSNSIYNCGIAPEAVNGKSVGVSEAQGEHIKDLREVFKLHLEQERRRESPSSQGQSVRSGSTASSEGS